MNRYLILMEGFMCIGDPRSYVVRANYTLVGSSNANQSRKDQKKCDSETPCVQGKKQVSSVTWLRQGYRVLPCSQDWGGGRSPWGPALLRPKKLIGSVLQWRTLHKTVDPYEGPQGVSGSSSGQTNKQKQYRNRNSFFQWYIVVVHIFVSLYDSQARLQPS